MSGRCKVRRSCLSQDLSCPVLHITKAPKHRISEDGGLLDSNCLPCLKAVDLWAYVRQHRLPWPDAMRVAGGTPLATRIPFRSPARKKIYNLLPYGFKPFQYESLWGSRELESATVCIKFEDIGFGRLGIHAIDQKPLPRRSNPALQSSVAVLVRQFEWGCERLGTRVLWAPGESLAFVTR